MKDSELSLERMIRDALGGIIRIEPKIHRMRISGQYDYGQLEKTLGKMKIEDHYDAKQRMPKYRTKAYLQTASNGLTVFLNPTDGFLPKDIIETSYPKEDLIALLGEVLPNLKLSLLENTIDIFCRDSQAVRNLLILLLATLFVPGLRKNTKVYGDEYFIWGKRIESNSTYELWIVRIYERGPDGSKSGKGWKPTDIDRLRIEIRLKRRRLKRYGLYTVSDLMDNSKLATIISEIIEFRKFRKATRGRIKELEEFYTNTNNWKHRRLMEKINKAKKLVSNYRQYMEDIDELVGFREEIINSVAR